MRNKFMLVILVAVLGWGGSYYYSESHRAIVNNPPPAAGPIVALGDSLTFGTGSGNGGTYPECLAQMIGKPIVNKGVPGNTIADAEKRLDNDVLKLKPSVVIVFLGGNDILQRRDMDEGMKRLESIVRRIQASGAMVVLVGLRVLTPIGGVGAKYHSLANRTGCVYVDDVLDNIISNPMLMADQIHPNSKGYKIVAERIAAKMKPYVH